MTRRTSIFALLITALLLGGGSARAGSAEVGREAMAEAMSRMMEAMGLFGDMAQPDSGGSDAVPAPGWPPGVIPSPAIPGTAPPRWPGDPTTGLGPMAERFAEQFAVPGGRWGAPWQTGPLEGLWESPDGGLLIVQGERYRLYDLGSGYIDGRLHIDGTNLVLRHRLQGSRRFEFALQGDRLALRSADGQLSLYRRLRLDRDSGS